jgi:adenosylhomocysteine nucleosidase
LSGIGLVVALPRELPAGFVRIDHRERAEPYAFAVYRHMTAVAQLVAVQAGVGRARAAEGARLLIRRFSPRALVSFGFAGGLSPQLTKGSLVIGTGVVCEDPPRILAVANRDLVDQFQAASEAARLSVHRGILVTTRHLVADVSSKAVLRGRSGACAVDMETAGIVEAACEAGLPWVAVRAIVDSAEDHLPAACLTMLRDDGQVATGRLMRTVCWSPRLLGHLLRLAGDTARARRCLSQAFKHWTRTMADQGGYDRG